MHDSYGIVRLANKYERIFEKEFENVRQEKEVHIERLKGIIEQADEALKIESEEFEVWSGTMEEVYSVDDAYTIIQKIEVVIMKWYVNYKYDKALKEIRCLRLGREKLKKLLNKLLIFSTF